MIRRLPMLALPLLLLFSESSLGHPPDESGQHPPHSSKSVPAELILPPIEGPKPWSDKPILNDPSRFHFAIMTDRTGGHRRGVWMKGVRGVNLMRPEFVVSVGDLIEGYTNNEALIQEQWKEFLGFIDKLQMRFFFVAGNHDLTNPLMHRIWRERFGPEWYSFGYKGVHFVCLCSEDPQAHIGDEQLAWLTKDLEEHVDARWTMVFLHKPLWVSAERAEAAGNSDPTNWSKVAPLLADRPHTVFAGHVHHYVQYDRNGTNYYHLATTGGGSRLRGQPLGEFDHVVWVTMEKDGPRIANLLLEGILPADVVTEESIARYRSFLSKSAVQVSPVLIDAGRELAEGTIQIRLQNEFDQAIKLSGEISGMPLRGLTLDGNPIELEAEAGQQTELKLQFRLAEPTSVERFSQAALTATLRTLGEDPLTTEISLPVTIDRRHACPKLDVTVDGKLDEWSGDSYELPEDRPLILGAAGQWKGKGDASATFRVAHDGDNLYISGRVVDDRITERDRLFIALDGRPFTERLRKPRMGAKSYMLELTPPVGDDEASLSAVRPRGADLGAIVAQATDEGYQFECSLPADLLGGSDGEAWKSFQLTLALNDLDDDDDGSCFIIWRGTRDLLQRNTGFAHFFREDD